jgi:hypothetical protein
MEARGVFTKDDGMALVFLRREQQYVDVHEDQIGKVRVASSNTFMAK